MKRYFVMFTIFAGVLATAFITTGCSSYVRAGYRGDYYSYEYGDGQPDVYYYNNRQQPIRQVSISFNDFYAQLSPYGVWVNIHPYGQVWVANVPNFQPYSTNGYWTYTTYGWTWVSNYSWGWAPFHYGRWGFNNRYGWYWVPGYEWGPAWVAWSSSADMYGWAPLMPGMSYNVSLSMNLFPSSYWTFMQGRYMGMNNIGNYYVNRSRNVTIIKNTTIINNYGTENNRRYSTGPNVNDVQRYTGRTIQTMRVSSVSDNTRAGVSDNELRVYRPVTRSDDSQSNNRSATNAETSQTRTTQPVTNTGTSQTRTTQPATNAGTSQTRTTQPATNAGTSQTRTTQPATNAGDSQTRTTQPATNAGTSQTRTTQPVTNAGVSQTRTTQPATQQDAGQRTYQPNPSQPKVTNNAAPQTSRQIQAAQNENSRTQQESSSSSTRSNSNTQQRR